MLCSSGRRDAESLLDMGRVIIPTNVAASDSRDARVGKLNLHLSGQPYQEYQNREICLAAECRTGSLFPTLIL